MEIEENGVVWGSEGLHVVVRNSVIRYSTYVFLMAFHSNYVSVLHRFLNIARYWYEITSFNCFHLYLLPPLGVTPLEFW